MVQSFVNNLMSERGMIISRIEAEYKGLRMNRKYLATVEKEHRKLTLQRVGQVVFLNGSINVTHWLSAVASAAELAKPHFHLPV